MTASAVNRYCCLGAGHWHRVLARSGEGVTIDPRRLDFDTAWNGPAPDDQLSEQGQAFIPWQDLDVPLPHRDARCWGYALTYPEHRRETLDHAAFRFLKLGMVAANSEPIPHRDYLDFELEIGVLMHRDTPERFGYFLANDLTDRALQVELYDARNPAPGFTLAKNFPGSLRAGPLLAVGDVSLWQELTASLTLNDQVRQTVRATDCRVDPRRLHGDLFREHVDGDWLLAITGTSAGTLFRSPQIRERLRILVAGGFSLKRAKRSWLRGLKFLAPGDKLVLESPLLGRSETRVVRPAQPSPVEEVRSFVAADGQDLGYVAHLPRGTGPWRAAFIYLHGIESHAGWFDDAAGRLNAAGYPVFCIDRRGSGINRENRGCASGHVPRGVDLVEDLHRALRHIRAECGAAALYLIGLSWGGKYAVSYDVSYPGEAAGLVLITPGIKPKVGPGLREKLAIARDLVLAPERRHRLPIEPEMFTVTPRHLDFIKHDPLRLHSVSAAFLWQSRRMDKLLARGRPDAPLLVFLAGKDRIIDNDATRRFLARHEEQGVKIIEYADQTHSIQLDAPERLVRDILAWVEAPKPNC